MKRVYAYPLRVYLLMGLLALIGIFSGFKLPISLFPNSAQPLVWVEAKYGPMTPEEYRHSYGTNIEASLRKIQTKDVNCEEIDATYGASAAQMRVKFRWGDDPDVALREVESVLAQFRSQLGNSREYNLSTWINNENSGFLALSFFSKERSPSQIFQIVDPILSPKIKQVHDADSPNLWNPQAGEVRIELKPEALAGLQITIQSVETAIRRGFETRQGGSIVSSGKVLQIITPRQIDTPEDLGAITITTPSKRIVTLRDIATISLGPNQNAASIYKTSGASSVVLFASPKPGGNVKAMADDIKTIVEQSMAILPKDIEYRLLVDPSEFIRSSITNVIHEVAIGSILAVLILFIFIGSPKNVATAAIEIPISLLLAFILMRISGMNINLISLGGLALSAGMNVDASVVVMENIFRHFESRTGKISNSERLEVILKAVGEVRGAVIASTISSLVVFIPLAFTSNLSYAILGDLAKAVVFSHGFSAIVALILVPTVRLHLMRSENEITHPKSPIEPQLKWLEYQYTKFLERFLLSRRVKLASFVAIPIILASLILGVLPRLPKEVVGTPDTDWVFMSIRTEGNIRSRQMETIVDEVERDVMKKFGSEVAYTFYQIWQPNGGALMLRLKEKSKMTRFVKDIEETFKNTATLKFWSGPWNPSELPLPDPPQMQIAITGSSPERRVEAASEITNLLESRQIFPRIRTNPEASRDSILQIKPKADQWALARAAGADVTFDDILQQLRVFSGGRLVDYFPFNKDTYAVNLAISGTAPGSADEVGAFSVAIAGKLVPLRALADVKIAPHPPILRRINDREVNYIDGRLPDLSKSEATGRRAQAAELVKEWGKDFSQRHPKSEDQPNVEFEDGEREINEAINQLTIAIGWSVVLIFLTMVVQFGGLIEPLIVLAAVPLGIIGVLISLYIFQSSLSLNSALGVILLNGIAVANSIILVDFTKKLVDEGRAPIAAAIAAAKARLRPILITSLTTVLGMIPIACGFGEGGKVLQPLGIAVAGGLWVSMILTLFIVPALHVSYLSIRTKRG